MRTLLTFAATVIGLATANMAWACPDGNLPAAQQSTLSGSAQISVPMAAESDWSSCEGLSDVFVTGFGSAAPSLSVDVADAGGDVVFGGRGTCDTVMLVRDPSGAYHFNDDGGSASQPLISLAAQGGAYQVWLGSYGQGSECEGAIAVSAGDHTCPVGIPTSGPTAIDAAGLTAGLTLAANAGGSLDLAGCSEVVNLGLGAVGFVPTTPQVNLSAPEGLDGMASLSVPGLCDTSLLAQDQAGTWYFNDDSEDSFSPRIDVPAGQLAGLNVWIGTYGVEGCDVDLDIRGQSGDGGSTGPILTGGGEGCPALDAEAMTRLTVMPDTANSPIDILYGNSQDIIECTGSVADAYGTGFFDAIPQASIEVGSDAPENMRVSATSFCDGVMLISGPDGSWCYNDDSSGTDPAINLAAPAAGSYTVWVGTYDGEPDCTGTLNISTETVSCPSASLPGNEQFAYGLSDLGDGVSHPLVAGGYTDFSICGELLGTYGSGYFIDRPDFAFDIPFTGRQQLQFASTADCDTVMLVHTPEGQWLFDDDGGIEGSEDSRVVTTSSGGEFLVWLGTFGSELCEGNVIVRRGLFKE